MEKAFHQAQKAARNGEIPVGAIIVKNDVIIASAYNQIIKLCDPSAHAEILALRKAAQKLASWRLGDCCLYVTLEPCSMCFGAILNSRIERLVFGAYNNKTDEPNYPHNPNNYFSPNSPKTIGGVCKKQCESILKENFSHYRK